jgi:muramoyltetrapeptide carboxypeptidase
MDRATLPHCARQRHREMRWVMKIAVVAPSCTLSREAASRVESMVRERGDCELCVHPQCFLAEGHFAGDDRQRLAALREVMANPDIDVVWFARGGYGSNRIAEAAAADLPAAARSKLYMGYSDAGFLHAAFHKAGLDVAWGPMPQDAMRDGGTAAVSRALDWIVKRDSAALEPEIQAPAMAFNLTVLATLLGTVLEPSFSGVDLLIEDVSEHHYRIDRTMFHVAASANVRSVARLRLGRVGDIPANDPDFGRDEVAIVEEWCVRSGIPFGGRADIGHDVRNRVVPFPMQNR